MAIGRRKAGRKNSASRAAGEPPSLADQFLRLENLPAKQQVPGNIAAAAVSEHLIIHDPSGKFDPSKLTKSEPGDRWEAQLPRGVALGLPGRKAIRLAVEEMVRAGDARSPIQPFSLRQK